MKKVDYIIIILLIFTWFAGDIYHLLPRKTYVSPFLFSETLMSIRWVAYEVIIYVKFIIFVLCIYLSSTQVLHWLVKDIIKITIGLIIFSFLWFIFLYGNPYYESELWMKFITVILIYVAIKSIKWHADNNNIFFNRRGIHRDD